jgi:gas vesicle protein
MTDERREAGGAYFALGAAVGAAVGAALGLLYAPQPGARTRRDIAQKSEEIASRARDIGQEVEARTEDLVERARDLRADAASGAERLADEMRDVADELRAAGEDGGADGTDRSDAPGPL